MKWEHSTKTPNHSAPRPRHTYATLLAAAILAATAGWTHHAHASTVTWSGGQTADWNVAADWGGTIPDATNTAQIGGNSIVTYSSADPTTTTIAALILGKSSGSAKTGTLNITGHTLIVSGSVTLSPSAGSALGVLNINGGTLSVGTGGIINGGNSTTLSLSSGTLNMNGNSIAAMTTFTFTGGTLQDASAINNVITQDATTANSLLSVSGSDLALNLDYTAAVSSGSNTATVSVAASRTVTIASGKTLAIGNGAVLTGAGAITGGTVNIQSGGSINAGLGATIGTLTVGTLTLSSGSDMTVHYSGSNTVDRITISGAANTGTASGTTITFTGSSGSLTLGNYILASAGSGTGLTKADFTTSGIPSNYHLANNSATELDLQHMADESMTSSAALCVLAGQTLTGVTLGTLTNTVTLSGSSALNVSLTAADSATAPKATLTSLAASTGSTVGVNTAATVTGNLVTASNTTLGTRTYTLTNSDASAITTTASVSTGTIDVVANRTFAQASPNPVAFGRFIQGQGSTKTALTANFTTSGTHDTTADETLAAGTASSNNITLTGALQAYTGSQTTGTFSVTLGNTVSLGTTTTNITYGNATGEAGLTGQTVSSPIIAVTTDAVANRVFAQAAPNPVSFGRYLQSRGTLQTALTANFTTSGTHDTTADETLAAGTASSNAITLTGALQAYTGSQTTGTFSVTLGNTVSLGSTTTNITYGNATGEAGLTGQTVSSPIIAVTTDAVANRVFAQAAPNPVSFGRYLQSRGTLQTALTANFTTSGTHDTTADETLAAGTASSNNISLTGALQAYTGSQTTGTFSVTLGNTVSLGSTTTNITYGNATGEAGLTGQTLSSPIIAVSTDAVAQRTFSDPATVNFGRVLSGTSLSQNVTITTTGLHDVTTDSTLLAYGGSAINGLSLTGGPDAITGINPTDSISRTISGTFTGSGAVSGTFHLNATDELAGSVSNASNIAFTVNTVAARTFNLSGTNVTTGSLTSNGVGGTIALGRVISGTSVGASGLTLQDDGTTSAQSTNPTYSGATFGNGSGKVHTLSGLALSAIAISSTSGSLGSFTLTPEGVTGEGAYNIGLNYTATVLQDRILTADTVDYALVHVGQAVSGSTTVSTSGDINSRTSIQLANGSASGWTVSGGTNPTFNSATTTDSRTLAGTLNTAGAFTNQTALSLTPGTEAGVTGTQTPVAVAFKYSAQVFSGNASWSGGSGSYGVASNWTDNTTSTIHAAPGTFSGFTTTDNATFSGTSGTITLDTHPMLNTLTVNSGSAYTLANDGGSRTLTASGLTTINAGGSLTLNSGVTLNGAGAISNSGTLTVNGLLSKDVTVNSGGLLQGSGSISGLVSVAHTGTLAPGGNSPGLLAVGALTLADGSIVQMQLGGTVRGTTYDALDIAGLLTVHSGANLVVTTANSYTYLSGDTFHLFDFNAGSANFDSIVLPTLTSGLSWDTGHLAAGGYIGVVSAVPEASSMLMGLLIVGGLSLPLLRRRLRSGHAHPLHPHD